MSAWCPRPRILGRSPLDGWMARTRSFAVKELKLTFVRVEQEPAAVSGSGRQHGDVVGQVAAADGHDGAFELVVLEAPFGARPVVLDCVCLEGDLGVSAGLFVDVGEVA